MVIDQYIKQTAKFTFEWNYKLLAVEDKFSLFKIGATIFPFKKVIKKEFPIMLETNYRPTGYKAGVYSYHMDYAPISLLQKHGVNLMFGNFNVSSGFEFKKPSLIFVPDSNTEYYVNGVYSYKQRNYVMAGYKYERSRCYQYRTKEKRNKEKNYLKKVLTNSQIGFDLVKDITTNSFKNFNAIITLQNSDNNAIEFPKEQLEYAYNTYYKSQLNRFGYRLYWEKEISYWYQKNWGFRFGSEIFKGTYNVKGSGYVMLRFGAFYYLNKNKK